MIKQWVPPMLSKALGTRPLDSVFLEQSAVSTFDCLKALWVNTSPLGAFRWGW